MFYRSNFKIITERAVYMRQQPVSPEPGRDGDPGQAEEDWLLWCESVENQLDPDEEGRTTPRRGMWTWRR